jgi:hypothetical protein
MRPWFDDDLRCDSVDEKTQIKACAADGCLFDGEYKAPLSRSQLDKYQWFCLEHVRQFNAHWDYGKGLSPEEIESLIRRDVTWQRPTRPLGEWAKREESLRMRAESIRVNQSYRTRTQQKQQQAQAKRQYNLAPSPEIATALTLFGLSLPTDVAKLRTRYRVLVKRHHPDINGGDKQAEERLKEINQAHSLLVKFLTQD